MRPIRRRSSPLTDLLASLIGSRRARAGAGILALLVIAALLAPVVSPGDPARITDAPAAAPSPAHWLGVTPKGQDVLAMTLWGARSSLAMGLRRTDFVEAAIVNGERPVRVMVGEMLPNMASVVMSTLLGCVNAAIGAQAGLEFLGLGPSGSVSWGTNLYWAATDGALMTGRWWTFVPSGLAIALVAYALALINAGVDEATNPRLRRVDPGEPDRRRPVQPHCRAR